MNKLSMQSLKQGTGGMKTGGMAEAKVADK